MWPIYSMHSRILPSQQWGMVRENESIHIVDIWIKNDFWDESKDTCNLAPCARCVSSVCILFIPVVKRRAHVVYCEKSMENSFLESTNQWNGLMADTYHLVSPWLLNNRKSTYADSDLYCDNVPFFFTVSIAIFFLFASNKPIYEITLIFTLLPTGFYTFLLLCSQIKQSHGIATETNVPDRTQVHWDCKQLFLYIQRFL